MDILLELREKARKFEYEDAYGVIVQYDLALENALLKLGNRSIQIKDLKNRIRELEENINRVRTLYQPK